MTQFPGAAQRLSADPVVPDSASVAASPSTGHTPTSAVSPLTDDLHNALALVIYQAGVPLDRASAAVEAIWAHPKLLDALAAYRHPPLPLLGYLVVRKPHGATRFMPASKVYPDRFGAEDWRDHLDGPPDRMPGYRYPNCTHVIAEVRELPDLPEVNPDA